MIIVAVLTASGAAICFHPLLFGGQKISGWFFVLRLTVIQISPFSDTVFCSYILLKTGDWQTVINHVGLYTHTHTYMCVFLCIYIYRLPCGKEACCGFDPWIRKIPWRRTWQPTPVFLPRESHGQRSWRAMVHGATESWAWLSTSCIYVCVCLLSCKPLCIIAILGTVHTCSELIPSTMVMKWYFPPFEKDAVFTNEEIL